jgi:hypothetical protein
MSWPGSPGQPGRRNGGAGPDAAPDEMSRFRRAGQLSGEPDEPVLDLILDGASPCPAAPPELAGLPELLADLSAPAEPGELALEAAVLARFRSRARTAGAPGVPRAPVPRKAPWRGAPRSPKLAAGLVVAAIGLGGAAAAYAGVLPAPLQDFAHRTLEAPAARPAPGHHPGVVPAQRPGAGSATPPAGQHARRSAAPGATAGDRTRGTAAHATTPAHPATPGRAHPSPQPTRHPQPGPPARPTGPPRPIRPPQASQPPHPGRPPRPSRAQLSASPPAPARLQPKLQSLARRRLGPSPRTVRGRAR